MLSALLAAVLCTGPFEVPTNAPSAPTPFRVRKELRIGLSVGGLLGSAWYVPTYRRNVATLEDQALGSLFGARSLDANTLVLCTPILGPLLSVSRGALDADRTMLLMTAGLQAAGLAVLAFRLPSDAHQDAGPELSLSPVSAGRLGLSLTLTGF